jgi:hypothetical protein
MPPVPRKAPSYTQINLAIAPDAKFEEIAKTLQLALTLPKLPGFGGCQPCFSGLDRFVFENPAINKQIGG